MPRESLKTQKNTKFQRLIIFIGILYTVSLFFDAGVTYYMYKQDRDSFLVMEAERNLVGSLKEGVSFWKTASLRLSLMSLIVYVLYMIAAIQSTDYNKRVFRITLLAFMFAYTYMSARHIAGGLSWLV